MLTSQNPEILTDNKSCLKKGLQDYGYSDLNVTIAYVKIPQSLKKLLFIHFKDEVEIAWRSIILDFELDCIFLLVKSALYSERGTFFQMFFALKNYFINKLI